MATNENLIELAKLIGSKQHDDNNKLIKQRMKSLTLSESYLVLASSYMSDGSPGALVLVVVAWMFRRVASGLGLI
jgi:hypothetical protein